MAETSIEWTDATWNPVRGCTKVSPGCAHCYAETFAERFRGVKGHAYEQGFDLRLVPEKLHEPLTWKKPRRVFVNSMSDLFQDGVPDDYIDKVFTVMMLARQHTFQVLTKRPARMLEYFGGGDIFNYRGVLAGLEQWQADGNFRVPESCPLPNVWLGVSVENQHFADERIPLLLKTPAAVRFISAEPLLEDIDLSSPVLQADSDGYLDWVIVGGESGHGARPFDLAWARSIVQQCQSAGVPCFVKQLGSNPVRQSTCKDDDPDATCDCGPLTLGLNLCDRKGGEMSEWPDDLRIRQFPA